MSCTGCLTSPLIWSWDFWDNPKQNICLHVLDPSKISSSFGDMHYARRVWAREVTTLRNMFVIHARLHGHKKLPYFYLQELSLCFFQRQLLWYGAHICRCNLNTHFSVHTCDKIGSLVKLHRQRTRKTIFIFLFASKKNSVFYDLRKRIAKLVWVASFHQLDDVIVSECTTKIKKPKIE